MDLDTVLSVVGGALSGIPDLQVLEYARGTVTTPAAVVLPGPGKFVDYTQTFPTPSAPAGGLNYSLRILLLVAQVDSETATHLMNAFLAVDGTQSIPAAFARDPSIGRQVSFAVVKYATNFGVVRYGGMEYMGCEVMLDVEAP